MTNYQQMMAEFLSTLPARGATILLFIFSFLSSKFLSTLPARGATSPDRLLVA